MKKEFTISYNVATDSYELLFNNGTGWKFERSFSCIENTQGVKDYIHYSILNQINIHCDMGYTYIQPHIVANELKEQED